MIRTQYTTTSTGAGRVVAKGGGKQRTITYDHGQSPRRNHGNAAGELALVLGLPWDDRITHIGFANSTHQFNFPEGV
jgi:hypothetical protein